MPRRGALTCAPSPRAHPEALCTGGDGKAISAAATTQGFAVGAQPWAASDQRDAKAFTAAPAAVGASAYDGSSALIWLLSGDGSASGAPAVAHRNISDSITTVRGR
ncbi:hypothetical protein MKOR_26390 [Mycolicibacillus koreensis]|nr:hypothetical protein MKOR_26390 [Mycolicibacillus koreensis]